MINIDKADKWKVNLIIGVLAALMFIPMLGGTHLFDWDEINFAECSREMIVTGDYLRVYIDYEPFWEKPPLFFWFQAASMHVFGVNEFAARFPNAVAGIITLIVLFSAGSTMFNRKFGLLWALTYAGSLLPFFYFKTGIIDPFFNLFMFLSVMYIGKYYVFESRRFIEIVLAGFFAGLAVLIKGPVGLLLPGLTFLVYWYIKRKDIRVKVTDLLVYGFMAVLVSLLWFGVEIIKNGTWFVEEFIRYQIRLLTTGDAGHSGPFYYHFVILLIGVFPASLLVFKKIRGDSDDTSYQNHFRILMIILLSVVLVIFSIVKTKIIHYSSLAYFPITFLAAYAVHKIFDKKAQWKRNNTIAVISVGVFISLIITALPLIGMYSDELIPYATDEFVKGNLKADVNWLGFEFLIGIFYMAAIITGAVLLHKGKTLKGVITLYGSGIVMFLMLLPAVVPKLEYYIQGPPIEFYKSKIGKDVYVKAIGFKSYADLFYSRKPPELSASHLDVPHDEWQDYLMDGPVTKPVYFVTKNKEAHQWMDHPNLDFLYEKNGWVFFRRLP